MTAFGLLALIYGFVVVVDPWDTLKLSPPLPRVPISSNARYSFPALARSQRFDSVVLGTSSSRLLQPALLDTGFDARFVNLAMNSATAWEQSQMFGVFLRAHPAPRVVIIGLDSAWCEGESPRTTSRPFPPWMYRADLWPSYREMLTPYAVQEAFNQFAVMVHLKQRRYGLDGYTRFVPEESQYDRGRRDAAFLRWPPTDTAAPPPGAVAELPALALLREMLTALPASTRKVLFFVPLFRERQGVPGSVTAWRWAACKREVADIADATGAEALDFLIPSRITQDRDNYWDPVHYRVPVATALAEALARGESADAVRLDVGARDASAPRE